MKKTIKAIIVIIYRSRTDGGLSGCVHSKSTCGRESGDKEKFLLILRGLLLSLDFSIRIRESNFNGAKERILLTIITLMIGPETRSLILLA